MAEEQDPVELNLAYTWNCADCGRENLIRTYWHDLGDGKEVMSPYPDQIAAVICRFCGEIFETEDPDPELDEEIEEEDE